MRKRNKQIKSKLKSQILVELLSPGSSITKLAKSYNVSRSSLHKWRRDHKISDQHNSEVQQTACNNGTGHFVELSVKKSNFDLRKASLIFDNFSISIEGKVSSSKLFEILKVLEEPC